MHYVYLVPILVLFIRGNYSCNEATCGSIVSKCLLTELCTCDVKLRSCSKDCFNCLGYLYSDCCSCVAWK
nr:unnamed protein product [Callosobruchus analis]